MTQEEIQAAAWKEFLTGAEAARTDWIDEEGEYGDDADAIYAAQGQIIQDLRDSVSALSKLPLTPGAKRDLAARLLRSANEDEGYEVQ